MNSGSYDKHHCFTCIGDDDRGMENFGIYADSRDHAESIYRSVRRKFPLSVRYVKTLIVGKRLSARTNHRLIAPRRNHPSCDPYTVGRF